MEAEPLPTADLGSTGRRQAWSRVAVVVALLGCAFMGALIVTFPGDDVSDEIARLREVREYQLWRALQGLQAATAAAVGLISWGSLVKLRSRYPSARLGPLVALYVVALPTAAVVPRVAGGVNEGGPDAMSLRIAIVLLLVAALTAPAVAVIWIVGSRARYLQVETMERLAEAPDDLAGELAGLRGITRRAFYGLAVSVSLAVVVTGQLRNAQLAAGNVAEADYPISLVLLYGAFFAIILGGLYLPVEASWKAACARLVAAAYPISTTTEAELRKQRLEGREWLAERVGNGAGSRSPVLTALATVSPFITSVVAYFVPTGN